jgi:hypothetical protein
MPAKVAVGRSSNATVTDTDAKQNLLTVERQDGQHLSYDPRRRKGVSVYREAERDFAEGDQQVKRSDCKEWAGTAFGTPIER